MAFTVKRFDSPKIIQMVITLPELNSKAMQMDLEADMHNLSGIEFIETSLLSKTMMLNYDSRKLSFKEFDYILQKWGCRAEKSFFHSLDSMK